ncbi:phage tail protein [Oceanisphaera sp. KMM 10153]|uniref:phage tail protein n=1 Tax=Oceanisphaera submarina TaxID=3390193 RepID=UPI003976CDC0
MMMTLGYFVFSRQTLPYQSEQDEKAWRHPSVSRIGARPSSQFLGPDNQTKTLGGVLLPEITGGTPSLKQLEEMGDTGKAYPLIDGLGQMHGMFVIEGISTTKTEFFKDGAARRIEFSIKLKRVDDRDRALLGWEQSVNMITGMLA